MDTARRVWIGFGVQTALFALSGAIVITLLVAIGRQNEVLRLSRLRMSTSRDIQIEALAFAGGVYRHVQIADSIAPRAAVTDAAEVDASIATYVGLVTTSERRALAAELEGMWAELRATGQEILARTPAESGREDLVRFSDLLARVARLLEDRLRPEAVAAFEDAMQTSTRWIRNAIATAVALLGSGLLVSLATSRAVARRVGATEAALTRRSSELQSTFATMQDGVAVFDHEANLVEANHALAGMHGYESAGQMRQHLSQFEATFELFDKNGAEVPVEEWPASRVLRGETYTNLDLRVRRRDTGVERILSYSARPFSDDEGHAHAILVVRDVTDSVRAQREFDEQRRLLQAVFDAAPTLIYVKDREGRYRVTNQAVARLHGTTPEQLLGRTAADFSRVSVVSETPLGEEAEAGGERRRVLEKLVTNVASGNRRWLHAVEVPPTMPGSPEPLLLGIATDITERKLSEEARASSETRFRLLLESMPDAVITVDDTGRIIFASSKVERLLAGR